MLGFLEDLMAVAVLVGLATFAVLRLRNAPERKQRDSRFYGSHTGPAWVDPRHDHAWSSSPCCCCAARS